MAGELVEMGERPGFNPLEELEDDPTWAYGFLAIRLFGLAILVPMIEEFFLRGVPDALRHGRRLVSRSPSARSTVWG